MKFMIAWVVRPDTVKEAVTRFLSAGAPVPEGLKSLGRWHRADMSGGFHLVEADDAAPLLQHVAEWADLLELEVSVVVEDAEAGRAYTILAQG